MSFDFASWAAAPAPPLIQTLDGADDLARVEFAAVVVPADGIKRYLKLQRWPMGGKRHRTSLHLSVGEPSEYQIVDVGLDWACVPALAVLVSKLDRPRCEASVITEDFGHRLNVVGASDCRSHALLELMWAALMARRQQRFGQGMQGTAAAPGAL